MQILALMQMLKSAHEKVFLNNVSLNFLLALLDLSHIELAIKK